MTIFILSVGKEWKFPFSPWREYENFHTLPRESMIFTVCLHDVYSMVSSCLHVYMLFTVCLHDIYNMFTWCLQYVNIMLTVCFYDVYSMFTWCWQYVYMIFTICLHDFYSMFTCLHIKNLMPNQSNFYAKEGLCIKILLPTL